MKPTVITAADYKAMKPQKRSKYGNKRVQYDGEWFDSQRELDRWCHLKLLQKAGKISNLRRQVRFELVVNNLLIARYVGDFCYLAPDSTHGNFWMEVVEDSKGVRTKEYIIKRKLMLAIHGITIKET